MANSACSRLAVGQLAITAVATMIPAPYVGYGVAKYLLQSSIDCWVGTSASVTIGDGAKIFATDTSRQQFDYNGELWVIGDAGTSSSSSSGGGPTILGTLFWEQYAD